MNLPEPKNPFKMPLGELIEAQPSLRGLQLLLQRAPDSISPKQLSERHAKERVARKSNS